MKNNACPNTNSQEWKDLVKSLGDEAMAHTAYELNKGNIPTPELAQQLLAKLVTKEKDEQLSSSSDQFKLKRAVLQRQSLERIKIKTRNTAQKATLEKIIAMNDAYQEFLKENIERAKNGVSTEKTISATKFVGSSEFSGDPSEYEAFKLFGTFMHEILELAQEEAIVSNKTIAEIFTREFFDKIYSDFLSKNPFNIIDLSPDEMFEMGKGLVQKVDIYNFNGSIVLPEITVVGTSKSGSKIIGRLDLLVIDPLGEIQILDFKTKKVANMVQENLAGMKEINVDYALTRLADKPKYEITQGPGTAESLAALPSRTTYDTWRLQLSLYDRILQQNGMSVNKKSIIALLYDIDTDTKAYNGQAIHVFENQDYYAQVLNLVRLENQPNQWFFDQEYITNWSMQFEKALSKEMPIPGEVEIEERLRKNPEEVYDFTPSDENMEKFVEELSTIVEGQMQEINRQLKDLKNDPVLEKVLKERKATLRNFQNIINGAKTKSERQALKNSSNFFAAFQTLESEVKDFWKLSNDAILVYRDALSKANGQDVIKGLQKELTQVTQIFIKAQALAQMLDVMQNILNDALANPENRLTDTSAVFGRVGLITNQLQGIEANFREISLRAGIEILKSPGEEVYQGVNRDFESSLKPQLLYLQERLEKLKNGDSVSIFRSLRNSLYSFLDKSFKNKYAEALTPEGRIALSEIENIERKILKIQSILNGYNYSDKSIEDFITGITNPKSIIYLGAQNVWNSDSLLKGKAFDSFIASASNSDLGISALTMMFKKQEAQARENIVNDVKMMKFDRIRQSLLDKMSIEQLNDLISEWREIAYYDKVTKSVKTKKTLFLAKPFSEEYEKSYREYNSNMKILNREVYQLKAEYHDKFGNASEQEVKTAYDAYLDKVKERDQHNTSYIKWLMENATLPYVNEWYELQLGLPEELRNELQKIYLEREILLRDVGLGDEVLLAEEDFDRLQELDIEQRKLFEKAKEENEEYAKRIETFNRLFEYDTNDKYYQAMESAARIKFADDPESFDRWKKENTITRPTAEWYETLTDLYERRSMYFSQDFVIGELLEQKREVMRPHKLGGRFNPKFLSEDEIRTLDEIESKIEERMEELKSSPRSSLTKEEKQEVAKISAEIRSLRSTQPNEIYVQEFNSKLRILENSLKEMNAASAALATAKTKGVKEDIEAAQDELISATVQFDQQEQKFKEWYEKNHIGKYNSIATGYDIRTFKNPKAFNYETLPAPAVREKYMETVPNPKYYKLKRAKIGNWVLDGQELKNSEIKELQTDPENVERLKAEGRLTTAPGAYNPNFIKGHDGIPLPKEIILNSEGEYIIDPNARTTKNVNPKYVKILNDPQIYELYNALTDMFFSLQQRTEGKKNGYQIPGIASSFVENVARNGFLKAFNKQKNIFFDKHLKTLESQQDAVENAFGDLGQTLRMRFTDQLSEELQTEDAIGAIMQYCTEAHMNIAMQEIAPQSKSFIELLKLQRKDIEKSISTGGKYITDERGERVAVDMEGRLNELNKVIEIMEFESAKFLAGQYSTEKMRKGQKIANQVFGWAAFVRIGYDIANQTKNYISGNVQSFLAAGANDNDHYSKSDYYAAKKLVYGYGGFLHNYFADWGRVADLNESTMLYRIYNPLQKEMIDYYKDISGGRSRKAKEMVASPGELGFLLQDKGDTEIGVTVMYAVMNSYRFPQIERIDPQTGEKIYKKDAKGEVVYVPVHQAYAKNSQGQLVKRSDVDFSDKDESRIRNIIYSEIRRAQGNYAKSDQTHMESTLMGKALFFFRKFLVPGMINRFGYIRPNWEGAEVSVGYWKAVGMAWRYFGPKATMAEFLIGGKMLKKMGMRGLDTFVTKDANGNITEQYVGDFYKRKVHHARRDAMAMMLLSLLGFLLLSYVKRKDDDDEEIDVLTGNAIRVIWGVKMETTSMFPVGGGSTEYVKNFTTAVPLVREATSILKMGNHAYSLGLAMIMNGGDAPDAHTSEYYNEVWKDAFYTRKAGPYKKGDMKLVKDFVDLTGIKNIRDIFAPENRIENLKKLQ